jgi:3-oxoacyl-[acyl-carrier protein] reductase
MKKVLISGGSRGIGRAIVEKFASMPDEYSVCFIYSKSESDALAIQSACGASPIKADLSSTDGAQLAAKKVVEILGGVDILINCAGISSIKPIHDISNEELMQTMSVNFTSAFILSRELSRHMINNKYGRIINIGSMWGARGASCEVHYSSSKAALRGLTTSLAKELGPSGITVNCIEPGFIKTEMNSHCTGDVLEEIIEATPLSRLGMPEDIADAVFFIASDSASFITAQCIGVDGGIIL